MADDHWLTRAERALVVGSGIGTVASIAAQNATLATAPLTVLVAVGLLNRSRVEQQLEDAQEKLARQHRQTGHRLKNLSRQVTALPSPEALTNFQRSVMDRNSRSFIQFSKEIHGLRDYVDGQMQAAQSPDLSQLHQDIAQLQDQYTYTYTSVKNLTAQMQRLSTLARMEAAETKLSQVRTDLMQTRVTVETLRSETRTTVANLQDTLAQFERQWPILPQPSAPGATKPELAELAKAVANLVPQAEFTSLFNHVKALTRQQTDLERALTQMPIGAVGGLAMALDPATPGPTTDELNHLKQAMQQLQYQVSRQESAGHSREQVQQVASQYLGQLKAQLAQLEGVTESLAERQRRLTHQWDEAEPVLTDAVITRKALIHMAQRQRQTELTLASLPASQTPPSGVVAPPRPSADWIIDFPQAAPPPGINAPAKAKGASRQALELALETAQQRLLLVWPWASDVTIDDDLLRGFTQLLERGGQLEIGWCHRGDPQDGRLAWRISQRWGTESSQLTLLKAALHQLLPLRENYPDQFKFKIMGSAESYLVCDSGHGAAQGRTYAIVGLKSLPTQSVSFPGIEAKLRTADPQVVQTLTQRFRDPVIPAGDGVAFFNRATTRHDLRDQPGAISDYSQVLSLQPDHAIALNNRGVAHLELNALGAAELDLSAAIDLNPQQFAAHCNRGWLRLEQQRYSAAIQDFTRAIALQPHLPMAYVYRGSALQKLGDLKSAVQDYSDAIACGDPIALPYCYRSAAYQSQGDPQRAIADLELASAHLEAQGDRQTLSSVQRTLSRLQTMVADDGSGPAAGAAGP